MATRTSISSGLWSAPGTWDTGVPADGDSAIIAKPHTVTFDNETLWSTGVGLTVIGILTVATVSGKTYYYKNLANAVVLLNGDTNNSCAMNVGSSTTAFPATTNFIMNLNGGRLNTSSYPTTNFYCTHPTNHLLKLKTATLANATSFVVTKLDGTDLDLRSELYWNDGNDPLGNPKEIRIDNFPAVVGVTGLSGTTTAPGTTKCKISSITYDGTQSTINISAPANVPAKNAGSLIGLVFRNVAVIGGTSASVSPVTWYQGNLGCEISLRGTLGTTVGILATAGPANGNFDGVISDYSQGLGVRTDTSSKAWISGCTYGCTATTSGGTFRGTISGSTYAFRYCPRTVFTGFIIGCNTGFLASQGQLLTPETGAVKTLGITRPKITGCISGFDTTAAPYVDADISYCTNALLNCVGGKFSGSIDYCTIGIGGYVPELVTAVLGPHNGTDVYSSQGGYTGSYATDKSRYFNTTLTSGSPVRTPFSNSYSGDDTLLLINDGSITGWSYGGLITTQLISGIGPRDRCVQMALSNASYYCNFFWDWMLTPGKFYYLDVWLKKSTASFTFGPTIQVYNQKNDIALFPSLTAPMIGTTGLILNATTTASTNLQKFSTSYHPTYEDRMTLRISAKNGSGTLQFNYRLQSFDTKQPATKIRKA